jgi:hypothetical protein
VQANEIDRMDLVGSVAGCDCILGGCYCSVLHAAFVCSVLLVA